MAVHKALDRIEDALVKRFPEVFRVVAHAEPVGIAQHEL
jgi:divalent metal cation (Fe/Co/Zn/Cd) transporter